MSTIVAVRREKLVAIAADFQSTYGDTIVPGEIQVSPRKIHNIAGAYVGIVGLMAHQNVMCSVAASKPDLFDFGSSEAIVDTLRKIHPILREEYHLLTSEDDDNQEYESSQMEGLVVSKAGVFSFDSYRGVTEYNSFWAAGSGRDYALGALEVAYASQESAKSIAEIAVRAACKFDTASGLPIECYELELEG